MHKRLYAVRKSLKMTQKQMADVMGIGQNAYSMIENGRIALTPRNRAILFDKLSVSQRYLEQGMGAMVLPEKSVKAAKSQPENLHAPQGGESGGGVPYFAKSISGLITSPETMSNEEPEYYINIQPFNECTFYRPVFGQSMSPRYNTGDIVACKRVQSKSNILFGQSYLCLISSDGDFFEVIRILRRHENEEMVTLMPLNASFDATTVALSSIVELYAIHGKIERNI